MNDVTLTVPAEYVEYFKLGVLNEIQENCGHLAANAEEFAHKPIEWTDGDCQDTGRLLAGDLHVLSQLPGGPPSEDVSVTAAADGCLEHCVATTARAVIAPRLSDQMAYAPMAERESAAILKLTAALNWAVSTAAAQIEERVAASRAEVA